MTPAQRRDDYEKSCEYATRVMRERGVREGRFTPLTDEERRMAEEGHEGREKG